MRTRLWLVVAGCALVLIFAVRSIRRLQRFAHYAADAVYDDPKTEVYSPSLGLARARHTLVGTPAVIDSRVEWRGHRYSVREVWIEREVKHARPTGRYFLLVRLGASAPYGARSSEDSSMAGAWLEYAPHRFVSSAAGDTLWVTTLASPFPDTLRLRLPANPIDSPSLPDDSFPTARRRS